MLFCSVVKLLSIGTVVVSTFALCWLPWTIEPRYWQQVLKRIFPVDRGLYEVRTLKYFTVVMICSLVYTTGGLSEFIICVMCVCFSGQSCQSVVLFGTIPEVKANV